MKFKITKKKVISYTLQLIILLVVVYGIQQWQTRNLLSNKSAAPSFSLQTLSNKIIEYKGANNKKTILYFFSPWCSVCKITSMNINSLRRARDKSALNIYAVALSWKSKQEVEKFAQKHSLNVPVLLGDSSISKDYKISSFPTIYIIDKNGIISHRLVGFTTGVGLKLRTL